MSLNSTRAPEVVIRRLPRYYRYLTELKNSGTVRISSHALAEKMNVTASQIRQDFNCFGGFGQQGYGYNVQQLHSEIAKILGLDKGYKTVIIGAGNLGRALAGYSGFRRRGFELAGIFDNREEICGTVINGIEVKNIKDVEEEFERIKPDIAILTVPKAAAQEAAEKVCRLGIKGIWNFAYMELKVPEGITVENVHLSDSLMTLSHKICERL